LSFHGRSQDVSLAVENSSERQESTATQKQVGPSKTSTSCCCHVIDTSKANTRGEDKGLANADIKFSADLGTVSCNARSICAANPIAGICEGRAHASSKRPTNCTGNNCHEYHYRNHNRGARSIWCIGALHLSRWVRVAVERRTTA
jgi:hypothetical protein